MGEGAPYFPPPRPGGAYREPAPRPAEPAVRAPVVVKRPSPEPPPAPAAPPEPSTYWSRYRFFARHPRALGAVLVLIGASLMYSLVDVMLHGGTYLSRQPIAASFGLFGGIWPLVFGFPLERGRPPGWWVAGFAACATLACVMTVVLYSVLHT